jgi:hypothetical protein
MKTTRATNRLSEYEQAICCLAVNPHNIYVVDDVPFTAWPNLYFMKFFAELKNDGMIELAETFPYPIYSPTVKNTREAFTLLKNAGLYPYYDAPGLLWIK